MNRCCTYLIVGALTLGACGDDDAGMDGGSGDAAMDSAMDSGRDTGADTALDTGADAGVDPVERGEYLVKHVAICVDCHTPRNPDRTLDETRFMGGNPCFLDRDRNDDAAGCISAPNLTPHATGVADLTDADLKTAITTGEVDGRYLHDIMPYWIYANATDDDIDAIVAYLRSLDPVDHDVAPSQPPFDTPPDAPATTIPVDRIPQTTLPSSDPNYDAAVRGRYLAGMMGDCINCHTEDGAAGSNDPIDFDKLYQGGRTFGPATARNLTPFDNALGPWTVEEVADSIRNGVDRSGSPHCGPMPDGCPDGPLCGMTEEDAMAIAHYLKSIPPVDNGNLPDCM